MPLFTSNSSSRAPGGPYIKIWLTALILVTVMISVSEMFLRSQGHLPTVTDDKFLWSYYRSKVSPRGDKKSIVLLGSSRIQLGVVPEVLNERFPEYQTLHLAVDGTPGYATFQDLANDPSFDGVIILSAIPGAFFPNSQSAQQPWVDYYHEQWGSLNRFEKLVNLRTRIFLQSRLVTFTSRLNLRELLINVFNVFPNYVYMQDDRYRPAYYFERMTPEQLAEHRQWRVDRVTSRDDPSTPEKELEFEEILITQVAPLVEKLRSHGGNIVILRMPTCDEHWEVDQSRTPKAIYWDQIENLTGAYAIHFKEVDTLANFDCPDTSHLDARDAVLFTDRLADELLSRNIIR